jgi:valyl-tRNA synthetase
MNEKMDKHYDPAAAERRWYALWRERKHGHADALSGKPPYSIVIPPPNVTGSLHMGHALNNTLQDILIRYQRMRGSETLWVFGTDHAGIATQNVVERELAREGVDRHALGRERFVERVWEWKGRYGGVIRGQLQRLGCSCDWERERFTMDEGLSRAVREVFVRLYKEGFIYQGDYIVNWCPRCHTALSDLEVEYAECDGHLWHIRYPSVDGRSEVVVATTRPETMLGDTAVAVNPGDKRYRKMLGKSFRLPLTCREIPMIADEYASMEFGTGAVKVTPAHDPNDFLAGERHQLPRVSVIGPDGRMTHDAGERYANLTSEEARRRVVEDLTAGGFLVRVEEHRHAVGQCYRCQTVVEPLISRQWFVRMKELAAPAIAAVREGRIRIHPDSWEKTYYEWMENIRDWCISRQIWWGHRIPVWACGECGEVVVETEDPRACPACKAGKLRQEEDVLDTWFSSALWPFSTLGWPEKTDELRKFYPTSVLVTAFDILFFWVARMIVMGLKFMGEPPFREVYIHALVRDAEGQKMSKSRGNVIDPLLMIDKYGADAFRFTLAAFAAMGRDVRLSEERIEGYRHFINKIWNAAKLVLSHTGGLTGADVASPSAFAPGGAPADKPAARELHNRWIRSRLAAAAGETARAIEGYRFNEAASALYEFFWKEYCDWYLELAKPSFYGNNGEETKQETAATAAHVLESFLRLLHPFMPFFTEEVRQHLPGAGASLYEAAWPTADAGQADAEAEWTMAVLMDFTTGLRNLRAESGVQPGAQVAAEIHAADDRLRKTLAAHAEVLTRLSRLSSLAVTGAKAAVAGATAVVRGQAIFLTLAGVDRAAESARLRKELEKVTEELGRVEKKLANRQFTDKAPPEVVEKNRGIVAELARQRDKLTENLARLAGG